MLMANERYCTMHHEPCINSANERLPEKACIISLKAVLMLEKKAAVPWEPAGWQETKSGTKCSNHRRIWVGRDI